MSENFAPLLEKKHEINADSCENCHQKYYFVFIESYFINKIFQEIILIPG